MQSFFFFVTQTKNCKDKGAQIWSMDAEDGVRSPCRLNFDEEILCAMPKLWMLIVDTP